MILQQLALVGSSWAWNRPGEPRTGAVSAYIHTDNRLALDAGQDDGIVKIELQNIMLDGTVGVSFTGFEIPEIDSTFGESEPAEDPADSLPDCPTVAVCRPSGSAARGAARKQPPISI